MGEKLGQHFLNNPLVAEKIVDLLCPQRDENILEIGPGRGFLTSFLLDEPAEITAVEIDSELARGLRDKFENKKLKVISRDFLRTDITRLKPDKICGNLPYQICGKIIEKILLTPHNWTRAVLMLPLAVAVRAAAGEGESEYSRLSVLCRRAGEITLEDKIGKENFTPPPKITSAIVKIEKKETPQSEFIKVVKGAFGERRKKLKNSLSNYFHLSPQETVTILKKCNINPGLRAQEISVDDFLLLTEEFVKRKIL